MQIDNNFVVASEHSIRPNPRVGTIQVGYLRGLTDLIRRMGGEPRKFLEYHDVDPLSLDSSEDFIEGMIMVSLFEYCSHRLHDPLFGLHLAEEQYPDVFGCATVLARAAPTVRQGVQSLIDYVPVSTSPSCKLELVIGREIAELRWRTDTDLDEFGQVNYHGMLIIAKTLGMLGGRHFRPSYAGMAISLRQPHLEAIEDRIGCRITTRSAINSIAFSVEVLDRPVPTANQTVFKLLGDHLDRLRTASESSLVEQVEACVRSTLSIGHFSVDDCAKKLGISARTLQRRLAQNGINFSGIVLNERIRQAKHALIWSDYSLDEIAFRLGYAEQTSFGRVFKQATDMTPQAFRLSEKRKHLPGS